MPPTLSLHSAMIRHFAGVETVTGGAYALFTVSLSGGLGVDEFLECCGDSFLDEKGTGFRNCAVVVEDVGAAGRVLLPLATGVVAADAFEHVFVVGDAALGVADRRGKDFADGFGAVSFEQ